MTVRDALTPQGRQQLDDYLRKAYNSYHGQDDAGLNELKTMAKSQPAPPADFKVKTANEIAVEKEEEFKKTNPQLALWMGVKKMLTAPDGAQYFESQMKGTAVPPLKGKVISAKPPVRSKELVVGVADPEYARDHAQAGYAAEGQARDRRGDRVRRRALRRFSPIPS